MNLQRLQEIADQAVAGDKIPVEILKYAEPWYSPYYFFLYL